MTAAYPLSWPEAWPRTKSIQWTSSRFGHNLSVYKSARDLEAELGRLGAKSVVISTNLKVAPGSSAADGRGNIRDAGAAVYFEYQGERMVMACDRWDTVAGNIRSLGLAIEGLRQLERHGGGFMMKRAFAGFSALPPPRTCSRGEAVDWRVELGPLPDGLDAPDLLTIVEKRFRDKARIAHSDVGGDDTKMIRLNAAIADARRELAR